MPIPKCDNNVSKMDISRCDKTFSIDDNFCNTDYSNKMCEKRNVCPVIRLVVPKRFVLTLLGSLGFFCVYALRVNLNVAMVAMVREPLLQDVPRANDTTVVCPELVDYPLNRTVFEKRSPSIAKGEFDWDSNLQGIVLGSFYYGYVLTQIPGGVLAERYGAKWIFGLGILLTAVLSLLTPLVARWNVWALILTRAVEGLGEGVTYPAMHCMIGRWIPHQERSLISTLIYSGSYVGTVFSLSISGLLCDSKFLGGWPAAFYVFGSFGCLWFVLWIALVFDTPEDHPTISKDELLHIRLGQDDVHPHIAAVCGLPLSTTLPRYNTIPYQYSGSKFSSQMEYTLILGNHGTIDCRKCFPCAYSDDTKYLKRREGMDTNRMRKQKSPVPWKKIFTSVPVWGLVITHFGNNWAFYTILTDQPTYLSNVLHFNLEKNGTVSAVPNLIEVLVAVFASSVADKLLASGRLRTTTVRKIMNSIAFFVPALCLFVIPFIGCRSTIIVLLLSSVVSLNGFVFSGFNVTHLDMSPEFAGTLMGITNCIANIPGFLAPSFVGWMIQDGNSLENWGTVFFATSAIFFASGMVFIIFCTSELQPWGSNDIPSQQSGEETDVTVMATSIPEVQESMK